MKNAMQMTIAAAALMVVAGSASAQTIRVQIPFYYSAGNAGMAPGAYNVDVRTSSGVRTIKVYNVDTKQSALLLSAGATDGPKHVRESAKPTLTFSCTGARCELALISFGGGSPSIMVPAGSSKAQRADVRMVTINASTE